MGCVRRFLPSERAALIGGRVARASRPLWRERPAPALDLYTCSDNPLRPGKRPVNPSLSHESGG
jgi:hypothetical protein